MPDSSPYVPPADGDTWLRAEPSAAGFDADALADAVGYAQAHETPWQRDLLAQLKAGNFEPPPDNEVIGPTAPRGGPTAGAR